MAELGCAIIFLLTMSSMINGLDIQSEIREAFNFHKTGKWEQAIQKYDIVIPFVSGKMATTICSNAGAIYMQLGNYESAAEKFVMAVDAMPESADPHFNLAVVYSKLAKNAKAIKHCGTAIKLDPNMHKVSIVQNMWIICNKIVTGLSFDGEYTSRYW
jgi:rhomboid protease GluP